LVWREEVLSGDLQGKKRKKRKKRRRTKKKRRKKRRRLKTERSFNRL